MIGEEQIDNLAPDDDIIVKMRWDENLIPPETVMVDGMSVTWHPCLLADVTPHDGPAPAGATFDVKRDNNLAHKNITIENPDTSDLNKAYGVIAGTSASIGVEHLIVDRSMLPGDFRVFIRIADPDIMKEWIRLVKLGDVSSTRPLPGSNYAEPKEQPKELCSINNDVCEVTLCDATRIALDCDKGSKLVIDTQPGTKLRWINQDQHRSYRKPRMSIGRVQGKQVLYFDGDAPAIELPMRLSGGTYVPLVLGVVRPDGRSSGSLLQATQRKADGDLSAGYSIQV